MDNLLTLALEAHNDEHNHHRRYEIVVGRDLLNDWTLALRYGRIGQVGQETRFASKQAAEIQSIISDRLRRRLSAPKRIGCAYRLVTLNMASGIDANQWLPDAVMARFFHAA